MQNDDQGGKGELRGAERQGRSSLQFKAYQRIYHGELATPSFVAMVKREGNVCAKEHWVAVEVDLVKQKVTYHDSLY